MYLTVIIVLFASIVCSVSKSTTSCMSKFPSTGVWSDEPPHWTPTGCTVRAFNRSSAVQCLKGKTVYVIGSSNARNYAFELAQLLGAQEMTRSDQKAKCQHTAYDWAGCVSDISDVKFKVLYLQYMDGLDYSSRGGFHHTNVRPRPGQDQSRPVLTGRNRNGMDAKRAAPRTTVKDDLLSLPYSYNYPMNVKYTSPGQLQKWQAPLDVCFNLSSMDCLRPFFSGSTANDMLILNIGINYAYNMIDFSPVNYTSWITESAVNFKQAVNTLFAGRVFRGTMSEVKRTAKHSDKDHNRYIWRTERLLSSIFDSRERAGGGDGGQGSWFTVDQWAINSGRADTLYQDFVHFHGPLTMAFLYNVLSSYCPD